MTSSSWFFDIMQWLSNGLTDWTWWQVLLYTLVTTHITIAGVTIFLHRSQAHRALDLHPVLAHAFRFWLWIGTGMVTKEWVAIHRKHHAKCETVEDPHSPQTRGLKNVLWRGAELYRTEARNAETLQKYGHGTPDDWLERHVYSRFVWQGVGLMLILNVALFGAIGLSVWAIQMVWIPFWAAGVVNGIGHYWGYRNFDAPDSSNNVFPWGLIIGGEELHNNHHTYPTAAKFSVKPYEFDLGWIYIKGLQKLGLAKVKKTPPQMQLGDVRPVADENTLEALITHRYELMARYAKALTQTCQEEWRKLGSHSSHFSIRSIRPWLRTTNNQRTPHKVLEEISKARAASPLIDKMMGMREELNQFWLNTQLNKGQLVQQLHAWCERAEASGITSLRQFSLRLRSVRVAM